jgi:hypothetical protein
VIIQVEKFGVVPSANQIAQTKYVKVKNFFEEIGEEDCMREKTNSESSDEDIS